MLVSSVADYLVERLKQHGVRTVFGLPGGALGPLLKRVLEDPDLQFVMARHESGAVAMADGYARATGRLGVCLVTSGPGALNALCHLSLADADNSPVLLVTGEIARDKSGRGGLQESNTHRLNVTELFRHGTRYSQLVSSAGSAPALIDNAIRHALGAPAGAAHLSIPLDLHTAAIEPRPIPAPARPASGGVDPGLVDAAATALAYADRPLVVLGNGSRAAMADDPELRDAFGALAERWTMPVVTTPKAKGVFAEDHPCSLGVFGIGGSTRALWYVEQRPDVVLVIGSAMGELATRDWHPGLGGSELLIQVDVDATAIGRNYPVQYPIVADARAFLSCLVRATVEPGGLVEPRRLALKQLGDEVEPCHPEWADESAGICPTCAVDQVDRWLADGVPRSVFLDVGNTTGWFTRRVTVPAGVRTFVPFGLAAMGWSNAAVVGGQLADRSVTSVALTGDGGFLMNANEISTAARYRVGAIWVVFQDDVYAMVEQGMRHAFGYADPAEDFSLGSPDLALLAEGLGAGTHRVQEVSALLPALRAAEAEARAADRPQVVVVSIRRDDRSPFMDRHGSLNASVTQFS